MMNYGELDARPTVVLTKDLIKKSMPKYKRHEDLLIIQQKAWDDFKKSIPIPVVKDENSPFSIDEDELASLVCQIIQKPACKRLAIDKGVRDDDYRSPDIELLLGEHGIVNHRDNHILYQFDVTRCMFSFGNVREKMRMADLDCSDEIVVDLFAGIGYFTLPLLIHAKAKHLYACEWNPDAIDALKKNLTLNKLETSRYTVIEGDNRLNRPSNVAQRVLLGILPSCLDWMRTAIDCLNKKTGGILHCHDLVESRTNSTGGDKQSLGDSLEVTISTGSKPNLSDNQSLLSQSITSSSSSHSTIERLLAPSDGKLNPSESDKDTNSPVLLERSSAGSQNLLNSSNSSIEVNSNSIDTTSIASHHEDVVIEPTPRILDGDSSSFEARGLELINRIRDELEMNNLTAKIIHIQPVKSYAPHKTHVVFDISIQPTSQQTVCNK